MADRPRGLIDTGAILALLNRNDRWHRPCTESFPTLQLPLATSAAILAEVFHLLPGPSDLSPAWRFLNSGAVTVLPITDDDLPALEELMLRYHDRPMDFADACIVAMSEQVTDCLVLTLDHDDFSTYRRHEREVIPFLSPRR